MAKLRYSSLVALLLAIVVSLVPAFEATGTDAHGPEDAALHAATDAKERAPDTESPGVEDHSHCSLDLRCLAKIVLSAGQLRSVEMPMRGLPWVGIATRLTTHAPAVELPPPRA